MTKIEHLLTCLIEEAAEVQQRATKALRFGLHEIQPEQPLNNIERLSGELYDFAAITEMLRTEGVPIPRIFVVGAREQLDEKKKKVENFLEYAAECDTLNE